MALIVLGPNKLPEVARQVGKAMGEIRKLSAGFQAELRDALEEPVASQPSTPLPVEPAVLPEQPVTAEATVDLAGPADPPATPATPAPESATSIEPEHHDEVPPA